MANRKFTLQEHLNLILTILDANEDTAFSSVRWTDTGFKVVRLTVKTPFFNEDFRPLLSKYGWRTEYNGTTLECTQTVEWLDQILKPAIKTVVAAVDPEWEEWGYCSRVSNQCYSGYLSESLALKLTDKFNTAGAPVFELVGVMSSLQFDRDSTVAINRVNVIVSRTDEEACHD